MGDGISKTTIKIATPYMIEARSEKSARISMESKLDASIAEMKEFRMNVEQQLAELRQHIVHEGQAAHRSPDTAASQVLHLL